MTCALGKHAAMAAVVMSLALGLAMPAAAGKTPDGVTPSVEEACDGLEGVAFGLCNAFCEAQDCDLQAELDASCRALYDNHVRLTGQEPPCFHAACDVRAPLGRTYAVAIDLAVDDHYCLFVDGLIVDCRTDWTTTGSYDVPLQSGCHVIAVDAADVFGLISAMIARVRVDGGDVSLSGDGTWVHPTVEPPPPEWRDVGFDDSGWTPAIACASTAPWGGAPAPLIAAGAQWVWDDPAGDCFTRLGEAHFRLELSLP